MARQTVEFHLVQARMDECVVSEKYQLVRTFARKDKRTVMRPDHRDKPNIEGRSDSELSVLYGRPAPVRKVGLRRNASLRLDAEPSYQKRKALGGKTVMNGIENTLTTKYDGTKGRQRRRVWVNGKFIFRKKAPTACAAVRPERMRMNRGGLEYQDGADKVGEGEGDRCREASGCAGEEGRSEQIAAAKDCWPPLGEEARA
ncbi:hypothetical protein EDB87DRAFT_1576168 [Lactarius vividus]|nr:hypothetical protein EDB87DRAFT_1576168 [Lactarius vividus]